jgi:hypothetical protein
MLYRMIREGISLVLRYFLLVLIMGTLGGALYGYVSIMFDRTFYGIVIIIDGAVGFAFGLILILVALYFNSRLPALAVIEKGERRSIQEWLIPRSLILDRNEKKSSPVKLKVQRNLCFFAAGLVLFSTLTQAIGSPDPILVIIAGGFIIILLLLSGGYAAAKLAALVEPNSLPPENERVSNEKVDEPTLR